MGFGLSYYTHGRRANGLPVPVPLPSLLVLGKVDGWNTHDCATAPPPHDARFRRRHGMERRTESRRKRVRQGSHACSYGYLPSVPSTKHLNLGLLESWNAKASSCSALAMLGRWVQVTAPSASNDSTRRQCRQQRDSDSHQQCPTYAAATCSGPPRFLPVGPSLPCHKQPFRVHLGHYRRHGHHAMKLLKSRPSRRCGPVHSRLARRWLFLAMTIQADRAPSLIPLGSITDQASEKHGRSSNRHQSLGATRLLHIHL